MALINCPECGKEISDSSEKCIHCGYPLKPNAEKPKKKGKIGLIIAFLAIVVIVAVVVVIVFGKGAGKQTCKAEGCTNPVYSNGYCMEHYGQARSGQDVTVETDKGDQTQAGEGFEEDSVQTISFSKNDKITTDSCEFTLTGYTIASKIEPSNFDGYYYHYYEASSGNVYIDVKFSIKNKATTDVKQADILKSVKIIYDNDYEYRCSFVTVGKDGDFEGYTTLYSISPLETMEYHMLVEVPNEVKSSSASLVCRVEVDGATYECVLR